MTADEDHIRELEARNAAAKERVAALKARNAELRRANAEMEAKIAAAASVKELEAERDSLEALLRLAAEDET